MGSIYSEKTLGGLQNFKKYLFRFAVGVLIFGVALGAILVLTGDTSAQTTQTLLSCLATVFTIGIMLMVTTAELKLIESRRPSVQILATIGLASNIIWTVLWVIIAWMPEAWLQSTFSIYYGYNITPIIKIASIFSELSLFGLLCGALMNIFEGERKDVILPLKITATVLAGYELLFAAITILLDGHVNDRFAALSGFACVIWIFVWLITLVISSNEKKRLNNKAAAPATPAAPAAPAANSDDALRAEIEEKVRREMIEKEVREKLEKEAAGKK